MKPSDFLSNSPTLSITRDGCPNWEKFASVCVPQYNQAEVQIPLIGPDNNPITLEDTIPFEVKTVISLLEAGDPKASLTPSIKEPEKTAITFNLPKEISEYPGIYLVENAIGNTDADNANIFRPFYVYRCLISIEPNLFGTKTTTSRGMPTLTEIRTCIHDTKAENLLLQHVEFSIDDLALAIVRPIREWNETPPKAVTFSVKNFPFKEYWLRAIVGYLLQSAAIYFTRNKLPGHQQGLSFDDLQKDSEYMNLSQLLLGEWREWMKIKKVEYNLKEGFGIVPSAYTIWYGLGWGA